MPVAIEAPIRERYVIGPYEADDANQWRTKIGWSIFRAGRPTTEAAS